MNLLGVEDKKFTILHDIKGKVFFIAEVIGIPCLLRNRIEVL